MHIVPPTVEIRDTGSGKGRGVFAVRPFNPGEIVETCPVVVLHSPLPENLKCLVFDWAALANRQGSLHALAFGYGSIYNHADHANLRYQAQDILPYPRLLFITVRAINAGEELTINYNALGGAAESTDSHWFEEHGIVKIP